MTTEYEPAAVPSTDNAPYLTEGGVSDEEFDSWVRRSQAETEAVIAEWDAGVEFTREIELDDLIEAEIVVSDDEYGEVTITNEALGGQEPIRFVPWGPAQRVNPWHRTSIMLRQIEYHDSLAQRHLDEMQHIWLYGQRNEQAIRQARGTLEAGGFVVVDREATVTLPRSALHPMEHRFGYFVSESDLQAATGGRLGIGLELPQANVVEWARRTFNV